MDFTDCSFGDYLFGMEVSKMDSIEELKAKRFEYLKKVWEESEGDEYKFVNMDEIGDKLGFDRELTGKIYQYLSGEGLIKARALGGSIGITHAGIVEMEAALSDPSIPTEHFPPVNIINNIINIRHMEHSQIQQGSPGATQSASITGDKLRELRLLVEEINTGYHSIEASTTQKRNLQAQIGILEAQLNTTPNISIVKEALKSIRSILEGIGSNAISSSLVPKIAIFLSGL